VLRLTAKGRASLKVTLKADAWSAGAIIVLRQCAGAFRRTETPSWVAPHPPEAAVQTDAVNQNTYPWPWADIPLGNSLRVPWRNTTGAPTVLYIDGVRTVVCNGDLVTISGIVVYDRRYKCKALRVMGEDSWGNPKRFYFPMTEPTTPSFFDCMPDE